MDFWKTAVALDAPNFYAYGSPVPAITPQNATRFKLPASCWSLFVGMRPNSRGTIHLTGPDPDDQLRIDANYLGDPHDIKDLITGLTVAREIGNSAALRPFRGREVAPGTLDAAQLEQFFRDGLVTFWHQCGTANMGRDETSVVDGQLRVYGVDNLRIADGSILPRVTTGNTMAPCVVIGEQAAALLQRVPRSQIGTSRESIARGISLPLPEKARLHMSFLIKERNRQEQQGKGTLDDNTKHRYQIICSGCPTGAHAP